MKKTLLIALGAVAMTAAASQPRQLKAPSKTDVRAEYAAMHTSIKTKTLKGTAPAGLAFRAPAADEVQHNWVDAGTGYLVDDISTGLFFSYDVPTFEVSYQKDEANPGWWRVVNPWKNHPYADEVNAEEDNVMKQTDDVIILINATDPDYVRILPTEIGLADSDGFATLVGGTEMVGIDLSGEGDIWTQEIADECAGILEDGVISFPAAGSMSLKQGEDYWEANADGMTVFYLPGTPLPVEYDFEISYAPHYCPDADGNYTISVKGDERIEQMAWSTAAEIPAFETDEEFDAFCSAILTEGNKFDINGSFKVNVKDIKHAVIYVFIGSFDADGNYQEVYYVPLAVPDGDAADWVPYGKADLTESFLSSTFEGQFPEETFEVDVERNSLNPGLLRVVEPYSAWAPAQDIKLAHSHKHFIYINAEDENNVYITDSPLGIAIPDLGEVKLNSDYNEIVAQLGKEFCDMFGITSDGAIVDNVLTFGPNGYLKLYFDGGTWKYTNTFKNPEWSEEDATAAAMAGEEYDVPELLPGHFKLDMTKAAGIHDLEAAAADDAAAVYYNLQGQRIDTPARGTVCIRVKAGKADKAIIL